MQAEIIVGGFLHLVFLVFFFFCIFQMPKLCDAAIQKVATLCGMFSIFFFFLLASLAFSISFVGALFVFLVSALRKKRKQIYLFIYRD